MALFESYSQFERTISPRRYTTLAIHVGPTLADDASIAIFIKRIRGPCSKSYPLSRISVMVERLPASRSDMLREGGLCFRMPLFCPTGHSQVALRR